MSNKKSLTKCECGCERSDYYNRMVDVEIEEATDKTLRKTKVKYFRVLKECKKPFEEELGIQILFKIAIRAGMKMPMRQRVWRARQILRMQHAIHIRKNQIIYGQEEGFRMTRAKAMSSAILFAVPKILVGTLFRHFSRKEARAAKRRGLKPVAPPPPPMPQVEIAVADGKILKVCGCSGANAFECAAQNDMPTIKCECHCHSANAIALP